MKRPILLCLLCLWCWDLLAQQSLSDSLQRLLTQPIADTTRIQVLDQLSRSLMYSKPFVAMQHAQEGLTLARKVGFKRGEARILNRIGTIFRLTGNYDRSLEAHLASVEVAETNRDADALARTYNNMGNLYSEQKNSPKAIAYYQKTSALASQLANLNLKRIALSNIGSEYAVLNKFDSALVYTRIAYRDALQLKAQDIQIELMILAYIYKRMNRSGLALTYYRKSIPTSLALKNDRTLSQTYLEMAEVFRADHQADSAIVYARKSLQLAQSANMLNTILKASTLLSEMYDTPEPRQALAYLKIAGAAKDSLENAEKIKNFQNIEFNQKMRQEDAKRLEETYRTRILMYLLASGVGAFMIIALILLRNNRHKQKANRLLQHQRDEINAERQKAETALMKLKATQTQLIQREKMASLGELTTGIAHEIQNPLNFVKNFSEVSTELIDELKEEAQAGHANDVLAIADDLAQNLQKITHHGDRAAAIVKGMLEHSRTSTGEHQATNLNALADEYLRLAYQGFRAKDKAGSADQFNCELTTEFDATLGVVDVVPQEIGRVLLNLYNNGFYAVQQKQKLAPVAYRPVIKVTTTRTNDKVAIRVQDNGMGISDSVKTKIFQPFFTTKPTGEGTGLGLSLSYDIVTNGHGGSLLVESQEGEGAAFIIELPL
ncbi:tetratricopeptide repeat-containing sensor histidine kinase [Spirosoma gilvum]